MSVADVASLRTVAVQLRSLSADSENQPIIAREEGCLRALISFVSGDDMAVAAIAVAALGNLASHAENFDLLRTEDDLLDSLKALLVRDEADRELRREVFDIIEELTDDEDDGEMDELDELEAAAGLVEDEGAAAVSVLDDPSLLPEAVTARLHVPGLSEDVFCMRVEQLVIRKPGVISVAFELGAEDAVVFGRVPAEEIASFVGKMTGTEVKVVEAVVVESEDEEEVVEPAAAAAGASGVDKENSNAGYLDQTGERFKDVAKKNSKKKNTISHGATSLAERLEAQRQEESRKKARSNRLMNSIGSGFNRGWGFGW